MIIAVKSSLNNVASLEIIGSKGFGQRMTFPSFPNIPKSVDPHCLNNLFQGPHFTAVDLSEIALELDRKERQLAGPMEYRSANVDDAGNFSIQVLRAALERSKNSSLETWHHRENTAPLDPLKEKAFVINRSEHWFTVRKLHGSWWNLNSSLEYPEQISEFYLSAYLAGLKTEGYSVFNAIGKVPDTGDPSFLDYLPPSATGRFYTLEEVLALQGTYGGSSKAEQEKKPSFTAFEGKSNRLDGKGDARNSAQQPNIEEMDEEMQMALAISASLQQPAAAAVPAVNSKEEMQAKRLAAMSGGNKK